MSKLISKNKRAFFEYQILDQYTAGIKLQGSEVKSIKASKVSIVESYCFIVNDEMFIKGMHIAEHKEGGLHNNHIPVRDRKLLLKKKEIIKIRETISIKGLTIVPLSVIISSTGFIKLEIGVAKGKNLFDKRQSIKVKDLKRDLDRNI